MRADRLISLLMFLQSKGRVTASEVAAELEVSERTARRDLEALAMSGVPLYSQHGRGGGWQLIGGATTNLSGLSADEARALFLAIGPSASSTPQLMGALRKLGSAIPETFRADAEAASMAVKIDAGGWSSVGPGPAVPHLDALTNAVVERTQTELTYESPRSGPSTRVVHPLGLVTKRNVWYLVADSDPPGQSDGRRTFRLDRVQQVTPLDRPVVRPVDFDLDAAWENIVTDVRTMQSGERLRVRVDPHMLGPLTWLYSGRHTIEATLDDGRTELLLTDTSQQALAGQLAGFGAALEIVDPSKVLLAEFARIAGELVGLYGGAESRSVETRHQ